MTRKQPVQAGHGYRRIGTALVCLVAGLLLFPGVSAGQVITPSAPLDLPFAIDAPPVPEFPVTISRDEGGRATIRAYGLTEPLRIDGRLDETVYSVIEPITDLVQMEPHEGEPGTERTEVWITFDEDNVYVSVRNWDTQPERMVSNEMRRDNTAIFQGNDNISFTFDTFYDRRNSVLFETNAIGGRIDAQVFNERQFNLNWNPIWEVQTGRFDQGWTVEAAIPFKSLRYRPGRAQIWGFNMRRSVQWKNEEMYLVRLPAALGTRALFQASLAPTLVGLEAPPAARNIEIKPYVVSDLTTTRNEADSLSNVVDGDLGIDVKYGITEGLTADFTYNTDFAQVEADEQQINLTRFSLFFPEKREFFLENQGLFGFGGVAAGGNAFGGGGGDVPVLFYSRRIGLQDGQEVPILVGGRLTGRAGRYSLGVMNLQTDDQPTIGAQSTNFSVVRLKRDILRRSAIGLIATGRSVTERGTGSNAVYGVDGTFAFYDNLAINTYWAQTQTEGLSGKDTSYRVLFDYAGDRYGAQFERLDVGEDFNPEVGFVRRDDMVRSFGELRFSPRPRNSRVVRKYTWTAALDYIEDDVGTVETREYDAGFGIEFQSSDTLSLGARRTYEFLPEPFRIASGVTLPVGEYEFATLSAGFQLGQQRRLSTRVSFEHGEFYNGHRTSLGVSRGRVNVSSQLSVEPTYSVNKVDLIEGAFTTHLGGARVTYTATPLMFVSALLQYNSGSQSVSANVRWRWEYRPGSELFVVYNEQRDTDVAQFPELDNRAIIVKFNRLFRF